MLNTVTRSGVSVATRATPMFARLKRLLRSLAPRGVSRWWNVRVGRRHDRQPSPAELFGTIYRQKHWGGAALDFYSGSGSHTTDVLEPFVTAVRAYLSSLPERPIVVDLGCGDFAAGSRLVQLARHYHACDVVPELIARNRSLPTPPNVSFHVLDAVTDPLPSGDVVIVKQVFQHLRNDQIAAIVRKLSRYPRWIITEHVPAGVFPPNHDKAPGGYTRLALNSGIVLTEEPFRIRPKAAEVLCEVVEHGNPIRTTAYRFQDAPPDDDDGWEGQIVRLGNGLPIEVDPRDLVGGFIARHGYWEPEIVAFVERWLRPGMTVVDAGAHVGQYTLLASRAVGAGGRVHAFEPHPVLFRALQRNIARAGCANVVAAPLALGAVQDERPFFLHAVDNLGGSSLRAVSPEDRAVPVQLTTLDAHLAAHGGLRVDLLKIDVEGAERDLLRGADLTLRASPDIVLVIEFLRPNPRRFGPHSRGSRARPSGARVPPLRHLAGRACALHEGRGAVRDGRRDQAPAAAPPGPQRAAAGSGSGAPPRARAAWAGSVRSPQGHGRRPRQKPCSRTSRRGRRSARRRPDEPWRCSASRSPGVIAPSSA